MLFDDVLNKNPELKASIEYLRKPYNRNGTVEVKESETLSLIGPWKSIEPFDKIYTKLEKELEQSNNENWITEKLYLLINWEILKRWFESLGDKLEKLVDEKRYFYVTAARILSAKKTLEEEDCCACVWVGRLGANWGVELLFKLGTSARVDSILTDFDLVEIWINLINGFCSESIDTPPINKITAEYLLSQVVKFIEEYNTQK